MGNKCCMKSKTIENNDEDKFESDYLPYDPSQEPIFPPELMVRKNNMVSSILKKSV